MNTSGPTQLLSGAKATPLDTRSLPGKEWRSTALSGIMPVLVARAAPRRVFRTLEAKMKQAVCRNLRIRGRVQGVGYRWSLCAEAQRLALSGWVRNRHDGSVEALVSGPPEAVDALLLWARRGPSMARVDSILCSEGNAAEIGSSAGF